MWWLVAVIAIVLIGAYEFHSWSRRNQNVKDYQGKVLIEWKRTNGYDEYELRELTGRLIDPPEGHKMTGKYKVDESKMTTKMWPPNARPFDQLLLKCLTYFEGDAEPIGRGKADPTMALPEQLKFASNMAYLELAARFGKNFQNLIDALTHPKQSMMLYLLLGLILLAIIGGAVWNHQAIVTNPWR
jgi:hypothetical protein